MTPNGLNICLKHVGKWSGLEALLRLLFLALFWALLANILIVWGLQLPQSCWSQFGVSESLKIPPFLPDVFPVVTTGLL